MPTKTRLLSIFPQNLASTGKTTTDNVTEGLTNLYYTNSRVSSYLTSNNYATQTYVNTAISNLVNSAPTTLDTLNELATALGNDANFSTTITNSIATKLPLSGGTLTGTLNISKSVTGATDAIAVSNSSVTGSGILRIAIPAGSGQYSTSASLGDIVFRNEKAGGGGLTFSAPGDNGVIKFGVGGTDGTKRVTFTGNGRVGVGTETPLATLDVVGGLSISGWSNNNSGSAGGVELGWDGSQSVFQSYDRVNNAYKPIAINGSAITISSDTTISGNLDFNGHGSKLSGHFYTYTHDGSNVYFHVGTATSTSKILNLRVYRADNSVGVHQFYPDSLVINSQTVLHSGNYNSYALPLTGGSISYIGINNASAINFKGAGSGTYNTSWIYSDTTVNSWEAPITTDSQGGSKVPFILTWRGGYASQGGLRLTGGSSGELGGNTILHAANYSSYALPLSGGTLSGNLDLGNGGQNTGIGIFHGSGDNYGRIRFYQAGSNNQTIHAFPTGWQGGTLASAASGSINISGANGVTFGAWNNVSGYIGNSGDLWVRDSLGINATASAKLHVRVSNPSGIGGIPSGTTTILDSSGNNYLLFRTSADNGSYAGIAMQDNNVGGYVIFGNAGGAGDKMYIAGYGGVDIQAGTHDGISPANRTTVASFRTTGIFDNKDYPKLASYDWKWHARRWDTGYVSDVRTNISGRYWNETAAPSAEVFLHTQDLNSLTYIGENIWGDVHNYKAWAITYIFVKRAFSVTNVLLNGDDPYALYINKSYVAGSDGCCTGTTYSYSFTPGWYRLELVYSEGGGGHFVQLGWNIKDYLGNIAAMTPFGPVGG